MSSDLSSGGQCAFQTFTWISGRIGVRVVGFRGRGPASSDMGHQVDFHRVPCRLLTAPLSATQLRDLSQWKVDLNPKPTESVGDFLARWIEAAGWVRHQSDFIRAIEGAESFEGWDREASRLRSELGYVAEQSPDPVLRFLHHGASRADFQAHW